MQGINDYLNPSIDYISYSGSTYDTGTEGTFQTATLVSFDSTVPDNQYWNVGFGFVVYQGVIFNQTIVI